MTPDLLAQSLIAAAMLWAALNPRKTVKFFAEECSHCEGWIRRDEMATEARAWLAVMNDRRVA